MKTTHSLLILMAVMSLMTCKRIPSEEPNGKALSELPITIYSSNVHVVTLYVNTTDIKKPNIADYADFNQNETIPNEEYTTHVKKGDIVIWNGVSTTNVLDTVNITQINHQGGARYFGKNVLNGNKDVPEVVVGFVTKFPEMENDTYPGEKYILKFTVSNNGKKRNGTFQIDPVIKGHH